MSSSTDSAAPIVVGRTRPLERELVRDAAGSWASAMIGRRWRYFAHARTVPPVAVGTIRAHGVDVVGEADRRVHDGGVRSRRLDRVRARRG